MAERQRKRRRIVNISICVRLYKSKINARIGVDLKREESIARYLARARKHYYTSVDLIYSARAPVHALCLPSRADLFSSCLSPTLARRLAAGT